jgi:uncharacterized protein
MNEYKLGSVYDNTFDPALSAFFASRTIHSLAECAGCPAKYHCSGGCAASNLVAEGDINTPYALGCAMEKKRLECAISLKIARQGL